MSDNILNNEEDYIKRFTAEAQEAVREVRSIKQLLQDCAKKHGFNFVICLDSTTFGGVDWNEGQQAHQTIGLLRVATLEVEQKFQMNLMPKIVFPAKNG